MTRSLKIAKELIAYQSTGFRDQLVDAFEELLLCETAKQAQGCQALARITALTAQRLGMRVLFTVDTIKSASVEPIFVNASHVLDTLNYQAVSVVLASAGMKSIIKEHRAQYGKVDLKEGRLSGDYSKTPIKVSFGFTEMKEYYSAAGAAAVYMHELGHAFYGFEFMFRTYRASQILAGLHQVKTGRDTSMSYHHAISACASAMAIEDMITEPHEMLKVIDIEDNAVRCSVVYSLVWSKLANDFGSHKATSSNSEVLADEFATKYGFGVDLAKVLASAYAGSINSEARLGYLMSIVRAMRLPAFAAGSAGAASALLGAGAAAAGAGAAAAGGLILLALIATSGYGGIGFKMKAIYKDPVRRIEQLRETLIGSLKSPGLSTDALRERTKEIAEISELLKDKKITGSVLDDLANLVFSSKRDAKSARRLEENLERLAHNELFVGASILKSL